MTLAVTLYELRIFVTLFLGVVVIFIGWGLYAGEDMKQTRKQPDSRRDKAWGMHRLLACADETDLPHIKKLIKDYPGRFRRVRAASRKGR